MNDQSPSWKGHFLHLWSLIILSLTPPQWREWSWEDSGSQIYHGLHLQGVGRRREGPGKAKQEEGLGLLTWNFIPSPPNSHTPPQSDLFPPPPASFPST